MIRVINGRMHSKIRYNIPQKQTINEDKLRDCETKSIIKLAEDAGNMIDTFTQV